MVLQLIDKKQHIFRVGKEEYQFIKPHYLYRNFGDLMTAKIKGSTLGWYINGEFLSYNQVKGLLKND